jgi:hypothetical protein
MNISLKGVGFETIPSSPVFQAWRNTALGVLQVLANSNHFTLGNRPRVTQSEGWY